MWMNLLFVYCSFVSLFCFVFSQKNEIRSLHHCHVQEISPGTLCLLLLPETVEKGHVQRARRQALLSRMFRAPFRMNIVVVFSGSPNKCGRNNNNKKKTTNDKMIWNLGWERGGSTRETRRRIRTFSIKMYTITKWNIILPFFFQCALKMFQFNLPPVHHAPSWMKMTRTQMVLYNNNYYL